MVPRESFYALNEKEQAGEGITARWEGETATLVGGHAQMWLGYHGRSDPPPRRSQAGPGSRTSCGRYPAVRTYRSHRGWSPCAASVLSTRTSTICESSVHKIPLPASSTPFKTFDASGFFDRHRHSAGFVFR